MMSTILLLEVMDKELSLPTIWIAATTLGAFGFVFCRYKYKIIFLLLPFTIVLSLGFYFELNDEFIGPAIRYESGMGYIYQSYIAILIVVLLPIVGALFGYKRQRNLTSQSS